MSCNLVFHFPAILPGCYDLWPLILSNPSIVFLQSKQWRELMLLSVCCKLLWTGCFCSWMTKPSYVNVFRHCRILSGCSWAFPEKNSTSQFLILPSGSREEVKETGTKRSGAQPCIKVSLMNVCLNAVTAWALHTLINVQSVVHTASHLPLLAMTTMFSIT